MFPSPLQRTLHPTGPTIPDTYCISTLACNNPTIPQNIIQKFPAQFFGTDTSSAFDQYGILNLYLMPLYSHSPCTLLPHINITVLDNGPTHWPCPLCTISPSNFPNWTYHHYLTLPCLFPLIGCVQSFVIDLPTCSNWTNYLHHTDTTSYWAYHWWQSCGRTHYVNIVCSRFEIY